MSLLYWIIFRVLDVTKGYYSPGRFIDLLQQDLIIVLLGIIAIYTIKRWNKIWK